LSTDPRTWCLHPDSSVAMIVSASTTASPLPVHASQNAVSTPCKASENGTSACRPATPQRTVSGSGGRGVYRAGRSFDGRLRVRARGRTAPSKYVIAAKAATCPCEMF
jgi:hypothetical protein